MSDDPVLNAVQKFMDAVSERIGKQDAQIRSLRDELLTRSAPQVIEGPPGKDGAPGKDGRDGIDGKDGKDGAPGERGADGLNGRDGAPGERGERGADSTVPGPQGERGADGIATREEIVAIVEERAAEINVRTFADIYRGVFKPGDDYTRGQFVTWGGSLWLSLLDTRNKPNESPDWKLVVKK